MRSIEIFEAMSELPAAIQHESHMGCLCGQELPVTLKYLQQQSHLTCGKYSCVTVINRLLNYD